MKIGSVLDLMDLPVAEGATSPNPGTGGGLLWSTTTNAVMRWNGSTWNAMSTGGVNTAAKTFSYRGVLAVGAGLARLYAAENRTITGIWVSVGTAPATNSILVDVNIDGTTIFTTQANRPTIAAGSFNDLTNTPDVTTWNAGSYVTVDIDQVGAAGSEGTDLTVEIKYTY